MAQEQAQFYLFALSDATGDLAYNLAKSASGQFPNANVKIVRRSRIKTENQIKQFIADAKKMNAVILFTFVNQDLRRVLLDEAKREQIVAMDVIGPALDMLSHYFHQLPSNEPGLQYRQTRDYYQRTEAIEFTVRHDEGHEIETLNQADIVIIGISRSSKTPLSIYLAYHGYRVANHPLIVGKELPPEIAAVDRKKLFGLTMSLEKLMKHRATRLQKMGRPDTEDYAQMEYIQKELDHAQQLFAGLPGINIIDVSSKAIEEIATEITQKLTSTF